MSEDKLAPYRCRRVRGRTPEPVPDSGPLPKGRDDTFVVHEHRARRLHWDLRLERGGVLVSWAVPKGLPDDPATNRLAVRTEDHPLEYASFAGEIPPSEYGGGTVQIWDRGTYETEKWTDREITVVLHGSRVCGRYVLFRTRGDDWLIHRMDPPDPARAPLPRHVRPAPLERRSRLPRAQDRYGFEFAWDGLRAFAYVVGGQARLVDADGADVTGRFPELAACGESLGSRAALFDGEIVVLDDDGRPDPAALRLRRDAEPGPRVRRLRRDHPAIYLAYDVLHLDGAATAGRPYVERRAVLDGLPLAGGPGARGEPGGRCRIAPWYPGAGTAVRTAAREQGLDAITAKRLDAPYGARHAWLRIPVNRAAEARR